MNAYSEDLRQRIVTAVEAGQSLPTVATRFAVSLASVKRYRLQWRTTGSLAARRHPGKARRIPPEADDWLRALLDADPDATLGEYCARWEREAGIAVSESTMCRAQRRLGWTVKKSR